jgi:hypothetical protein
MMLIPQAEIERALIVSNEKIFDQHGVRRSGEIAPPMLDPFGRRFSPSTANPHTLKGLH